MAGSVLGVLSAPKNLLAFTDKYGLELHSELDDFADSLSSAKSGIADIVIPPGSHLIGKSARDLWMRKFHGIYLVALPRARETLREVADILMLPFEAS